MARGADVSGNPVVLVINDEEWTARSLESILKPHGFAVLLAYTGGAGLELARRVQPDIVLIDLRLPDMEGTDVCARMRQIPGIRPSTPILAFSSTPVGRSERLACLREGVWEVLRPPFDPDELLSRLGTFVAAKQDADLARSESHQDPLTGFYNVRGLIKRVTEITADATRHHRPVACVILGTDRGQGAGRASLLSLREGVTEEREDGNEGEIDDSLVRSLANALVSVTRLSDVVARVGEGEFVIVAPATDPAGATRLAERVLEVIDQDPVRFGLPEGIELKAGFHAVAEPDRETVIPEELLTRATTALRAVQAEGNGSRIRGFQPEPDA